MAQSFVTHSRIFIDWVGDRMIEDLVNSLSLGTISLTKPYLVRNRITSSTIIPGWPERLVRSGIE